MPRVPLRLWCCAARQHSQEVKTKSGWNLFPAVVESNGKLKDKIRVRGKVEVHPEGSYYLEWRVGKSRLRLMVPEKADVLDLARRKRLELEASKAGVPLAQPADGPGGCGESAKGRY